MTVCRTILMLFAACACAWAGDAKSPVATAGDWEYSLSAGPAWRRSGTLNFTGGSLSGSAFIPSFVGSNVLIVPPIGPATEIGDRFYDDGYVRTDPSTAIDGYTGYWGYQNATQVAGDNLAMHATGFQSIRSDSLTRSTAPAFDRREQGISPVHPVRCHVSTRDCRYPPGL